MSNKQQKYLISNPQPSGRLFCMLPKIHKDLAKYSRPQVIRWDSEAGYIEHFLNPLSCNTPHTSKILVIQSINSAIDMIPLMLHSSPWVSTAYSCLPVRGHIRHLNENSAGDIIPTAAIFLTVRVSFCMWSCLANHRYLALLLTAKRPAGVHGN